MPQSSLCLEILGTSINITVDEDPSYLEKLLADYRDKVESIRQSTGLKDPLKIAVLTGYSLCDELWKAGEDRKKGEDSSGTEKEETLRRTLNLIARLDETIGKDPFPVDRGFYPLKNPVKHYQWGSPLWIPRMLGMPNPGGEPWAELWMGAHPASPSMLAAEGMEKSLDQFIAADPPRYLGEEWAESRTLPFLFKFLAASRPLSIQAHPGKEQARQGWLRENEQGVPLDAPERNYRDDNHKPEIICALSPFTALCGFRPPADIRSLVSLFFANAPPSLRNGFAPLWRSLADTEEDSSALRSFFKNLFAIPPDIRTELTNFVLSASLPPNFDRELGALIRSFAEFYPGDPGILSPLYLNLIHLENGQAIYLPPGILHAYVEGFGVELMANSDNVLRGGLSSKHIDQNELMKVLFFSPFVPELLKAPESAAASGFSGIFSYPSHCKEFCLSIAESFKGPFPLRGPAVVAVTRGRLQVSGSGDAEWELKQGESAFIPPESRLTLGGDYTLYAASLPLSTASPSYGSYSPGLP
ncbi:MAG: mannose-6-phosphate isomerase, class I [Treponema sp.]|jgi:mannose-6-phosphate isomerase|nr:mannose-6-phosphate isomerase, class I [Treponema sp.]